MERYNTKLVTFRVLKIEDVRKSGSRLELGGIYKGLYHPSNNSIQYEDFNSQDWIFWVGDTCEIIDN